MLITKFYKSANDAALLAPEKWKLEGKAYVNMEGTAIKKQENTTTKQTTTREIRANELHENIGNVIMYNYYSLFLTVFLKSLLFL